MSTEKERYDEIRRRMSVKETVIDRIENKGLRWFGEWNKNDDRNEYSNGIQEVEECVEDR